jgi:hypothetical protein
LLLLCTQACFTSLVALLLYAYPALVICWVLSLPMRMSRETTPGFDVCEWRLHVGHRTFGQGGLEGHCPRPLCSLCVLAVHHHQLPGGGTRTAQWQAAPSLFSAPRYRTCA